MIKILSLQKILDLYNDSIYPQGKETFLLLDEIQYSKEWETEIKLLVDHHPGVRILATGSASVVHRERLAESGVGRWITVPIPTLSFYEFVQILGEKEPAIPDTLKPSDLFSIPQKELANLARCFRGLLPFEVKYREHPNLSMSSGLVAYCRLEKQAKRAYWVTKQDNDFGVTTFKGLEDEHGEQTQFLKIPAHILCYLIGQAEVLLWK